MLPQHLWCRPGTSRNCSINWSKTWNCKEAMYWSFSDSGNYSRICLIVSTFLSPWLRFSWYACMYDLTMFTIIKQWGSGFGNKMILDWLICNKQLFTLFSSCFGQNNAFVDFSWETPPSGACGQGTTNTIKMCPTQPKTFVKIPFLFKWIPQLNFWSI